MADSLLPPLADCAQNGGSVKPEDPDLSMVSGTDVSVSVGDANPDSLPKMYIATYKGVDVYETFIDGNPLMRRVSDDWVNSTQILKIAKFPKAQRTRILEREIQTGTHQKIQGGNGRYQGTWVPLYVAQTLATTHGLTDLISIVIDFDSKDSNTLQRFNKVTKLVSNPKRKKVVKKRNPSNRAHFDAKGVPFNSEPKQPHVDQGLIQRHQQLQMAQGQQFLQSQFVPFNGYHPPPQQQQQQPQQFAYRHPGQIIGQQVYQRPQENHLQHPPQQQQRPHWEYQQFAQPFNYQGIEEPVVNHEVLNDSNPVYSKQLIEYFSQGVEDNLPSFILNPNPDFKIDASIDSEGHSPLHWAAAMGNLKLVSLLISKNANCMVQNTLGLNPLSRLVTFNNCYEKKNFVQVLEYLKESLYRPDKNNRLILHYLCQFSEIKTKIKSILYYFDIVLEEMKQQNEFCNEQMIKISKEKEAEASIESQKDNFIKMIVNHRDVDGDTPLHLAIKSKNEYLIKKLLEHGGDLTLINSLGETPFNLLSRLDIPIDIKELKKNPPVTVAEPDTSLSASFLVSPIKKIDFEDLVFSINSQHDFNINGSPNKEFTINVFDDPEMKKISGIDIKKMKVLFSSQLDQLETTLQHDHNTLDNERNECVDLSEKLNTDLNLTDVHIRNSLSSIYDISNNSDSESLKNILASDLEKELLKDQVNNKVIETEQVLFDKAEFLLKLIERSQAKTIADLVTKEEGQMKPEKTSNKQRATKEKLKLLTELSQLQIQRQEKVDDLINSMVNHTISRQMNNYRKLISISCGLKMESIDDLIDGIEKALLS